MRREVQVGRKSGAEVHGAWNDLIRRFNAVEFLAHLSEDSQLIILPLPPESSSVDAKKKFSEVFNEKQTFPPLIQ